MAFTVLPAVHLSGAAFPDHPEGKRPLEVATALAREFGFLYVVDVDAVRLNKPDLEFARELTRNRPVWLDTGPRGAGDAMDALVAGAERLSVRWAALQHAEALADLVDLAEPESFFLLLEHDARGEFIRNPRVRHVDAAAAERLARDAGLGVVVAAPAFDPGLARRYASDARVWWYGPLTRAEAPELRRLRYAGAIVPAPVAREAAEGAKEGEVTPE